MMDDTSKNAPCFVCGKSNWKAVYKISEWDIKECLSCGFAKIDPLPDIKNRRDDYSKDKVIERNIKKKTFFQKFSRFLKQAFSRILTRNKNKIFYDKLLRRISPGGRILDIGCGDGSFLKLAKEKFDCAGIEISDYLASIARLDKDLKILTGNFVTLDFSGEKYSGITLISLLEHLSNPDAAIKKCFELMDIGGIILLKTVNYNCLNRRIKGKGWTGFRPPDHVIYFSPGNLKLFLKKIGFRKVKVSSWIFNDNMYCEAWK